MSTILDITVRKQAEAQLQLRTTALEAAANAIIITDREGTIVWVNPAVTLLTGYRAQELLGENLRLLKSGHHDTAFFQDLWNTIIAGQIWHGEIINRRKDGSLYTEEQTIAPVRDSRSQITHFIAIKQDVTARKRADVELTAAHTELAQLYETTKDLAARWEALFTLSRLLNRSLELYEVFGTFATAVESYVRYDRLGVILSEGDQLKVAYCVAHPPLAAYQGQSWPKTNNTAIEWMLTHREPRLVRDLVTEAGFRDETYLVQEGVRSVLGLPLLAGGEALGVFFLDSLTTGAYSSGDIERLLPLADQVAIVVEHSRLWGSVQRQAEELKREVEERKRAETSLRDANREISASMRALESRTAELQLLREMIDLMQSSISADEAYDVVQRYLARLFPQDTGALYLFPPALDALEKSVAWGEHTALLTPVFAPEECWALRRGHVHHVLASRGDAVCRHTPAVDRVEGVCVPMLAQGHALGILHFFRIERDDATMAEPSFLTLAETVANSIGLAIANLRLRETLRQQSIRDPLTGLFNRRYLDETLRREILRATRAGSTLGVIMLDIDHFKRFNDTYGHEAGDTVLAALGKFLLNQVRGDDIACRYGGEEFTLILPGASLEIVRERAEQLRIGAQSLTMRVNGTQVETITLSLGVAAAPQYGDTADAVLQAADAALYRAKQGGRNRVKFAM